MPDTARFKEMHESDKSNLLYPIGKLGPGQHRTRVCLVSVISFVFADADLFYRLFLSRMGTGFKRQAGSIWFCSSGIGA